MANGNWWFFCLTIRYIIYVSMVGVFVLLQRILSAWTKSFFGKTTEKKLDKPLDLCFVYSKLLFFLVASSYHQRLGHFCSSASTLKPCEARHRLHQCTNQEKSILQRTSTCQRSEFGLKRKIWHPMAKYLQKWSNYFTHRLIVSRRTT